MKKSKFNIYSILAGIVLFLLSVSGYSQEAQLYTRDTKLSKEEKKAAKKEKDLRSFMEVDTMVQNRRFVLEADYLQNKFGIRQPVSSLLNFIEVEVSDAVLQTGSDNILVGYNNVGGVTAEGRIQGFKVTKNEKNRSFFLRFSVMTQIGVYDVAMTIHSDKNARAEISGMGPEKLTFSGRIMNPWESRAFKGRNSI